MTDNCVHYCVLRIDTGAVIYLGSSLVEAAVAWDPGRCYGKDEFPALAVAQAHRRRKKHLVWWTDEPTKDLAARIIEQKILGARARQPEPAVAGAGGNGEPT